MQVKFFLLYMHYLLNTILFYGCAFIKVIGVLSVNSLSFPSLVYLKKTSYWVQVYISFLYVYFLQDFFQVFHLMLYFTLFIYELSFTHLIIFLLQIQVLE